MKKYIFFVVLLFITIISCKRSYDFNSWQKDIINSFSKGQTFTYLVNDTDTISFIVSDVTYNENGYKNVNITLTKQGETHYENISIYMIADDIPDDNSNNIDIDMNINNYYYFVSGKIRKGINYPYKGNKIPTVYFLTSSDETQKDTVIIKPNTGIIHVVLNSNNQPLSMDILEK